MQGAGSEAKGTPVSRGDRGKLKNLPFDEALDLSASDASMSRGPSEQRGDGAKGEVTLKHWSTLAPWSPKTAS